MKCKYCGAEIKEGSTVCEYCDSEVERKQDIPEPQTIIIEEKSEPRGVVIKTVGKVVIGLACIWAVVMVLFLVILLNSDTFKEINEYSSGTDTTYELPANEEGLFGSVVSCGEDGVASIEYQNHTYENVKILDGKLMEWLCETNKTIDGIEIYFSTDKKRDICEIGLLSADFFVTGKKGDYYTAIRGDTIIKFTSSNPIEIDCCYSGYFSYPDMNLCWEEEQSVISMEYMDMKCADKEELVWKENYTGEELDVYRIFAGEQWYYCSSEIYDAIQIAAGLEEYQLCQLDTLAFIIKK